MSHIEIVLPFGLPPAKMAKQLVHELEIDALAAYRDALAQHLEGTRFTYTAYWMLDTARLDHLVGDLRSALG